MANRHTKQREIWDEEHLRPFMFPFVASMEPNPGVEKFWDWLVSHGVARPLKGLEICCGKGRNAIWLAKQGGVEMTAFDFSDIAIEEANQRLAAETESVDVHFEVQDATKRWPYADHQFDFVVDCFGSSDIETSTGRANILDESLRVLKPGGFFSFQIDTPDLGFFAERLKEAPGIERNTLIFPNGKIESILTQNDIENWSHGLRLIEVQTPIEEGLEIFGQSAPYKYFWIIAQAPSRA